MQVMVNCSDEIKRHGQLSVGKSYLNHLLETERYAEVKENAGIASVLVSFPLYPCYPVI